VAASISPLGATTRPPSTSYEQHSILVAITMLPTARRYEGAPKPCARWVRGTDVRPLPSILLEQAPHHNHPFG
jgi:hypothetical protein